MLSGTQRHPILDDGADLSDPRSSTEPQDRHMEKMAMINNDDADYPNIPFPFRLGRCSEGFTNVNSMSETKDDANCGGGSSGPTKKYRPCSTCHATSTVKKNDIHFHKFTISNASSLLVAPIAPSNSNFGLNVLKNGGGGGGGYGGGITTETNASGGAGFGGPKPGKINTYIYRHYLIQPFVNPFVNTNFKFSFVFLFLFLLLWNF